ncbi:MAG: hypothetical protein RMJ84_13675, partial [Sandaracinaceae bacterium]|nr:hypothetical protein [Sandaracinaceae bacterium]
VFVQEEGEWRVDGGLWGLPALDTPERAIAAFHRALAREIELGVGPLLASASRQRWLEEKIRYRDGTALPGAVRIEVRGSQALALTPLGDAIELVKEGGEWRILAIRPYGFQKDLH